MPKARQQSRSWKETGKLMAISMLVMNVVVGAATNYKQSLSVFAAVRPLQVAEDIALVGVVGAILSVLGRLHPVFHWWVGRLFRARGEPFNLNLLPMSSRWLGPAYLLLLAFVIPQIARYEENLFRKGTEGWQEAVLRSLLFGLVHLLVGVSLAAALAIAAGGMWFSYCYFQGGVPNATVHHATYDCIIVLAVLFQLLRHREKLIAHLDGETP